MPMTPVSRICLVAAVTAALALACSRTSTDQRTTSTASPEVAADKAADTIYLGGPILTMEGDEPRYVEALAAKSGKIVAVGAKGDVLGLRGAGTHIVDLQGKDSMK